MRKRLQNTRRNVRFRQWSRKAYAVFASLGVCVTIGQLRKNVTERALCKQQAPLASVATDRPTEERPPKETDTEPIPNVWQELLMQLLQPLPTTTVCQWGNRKHTNKNRYTSPTLLGGVEPHPYRSSMACRGGALLRPKCYNPLQSL